MLLKPLKHILVLTVFSFYHLTASATAASNEQAAIIATLNNYFQGTAYNQPDVIKKAFSDSATLNLEKKDTPNWVVPAAEYISWFEGKIHGQFNGRIGEILSIDIVGNIATAKAEILYPERDLRMIDMFLLRKLNNQWQIISKAATRTDETRNEKRILFIVSSALFHGDSDLATGVSFSELVNAYHTFEQGGYNVDFVSTQGGPIPLSYINTSKELHRQYIYDPDFMYALANTKHPAEVKPENYLAVHYVGGGNAMYEVAENQLLQDIAMTIYQQHNGIVSSVCHGTAGIVNLKQKDGTYLVQGKRISGYPDEYEKTSAAYYQHFPFSIEKTIEARGGDFHYGGRSEAYVEVDGRVVTGTNYQSSKVVAQKIIEILDRAMN